MKHKVYSVLSALLLCMMLLSPVSAKEGAMEGLILWYRNLLPALFPYTILSLYMLGQTGKQLRRPRLPARMLTQLTGISPEGLFACFTGFLCGYPLGAKMTAELVKTRRITKEEGQYLLCFCNNASPAFLIQFVSLGVSGTTRHAPALLCSIYGAAILTALLLQPVYRKHRSSQSACLFAAESNAVTMSACILDACEAMVRLCGYMVLFSITAKMVTGHIAAVTTWKAFLIGMIEITNGVAAISACGISFREKLLLLSFCISFGGICCYAQSSGMCQDSGLSMPRYLLTKLLNAFLALLIMYAYQTIIA